MPDYDAGIAIQLVLYVFFSNIKVPVNLDQNKFGSCMLRTQPISHDDSDHQVKPFDLHIKYLFLSKSLSSL